LEFANGSLPYILWFIGSILAGGGAFLAGFRGLSLAFITIVGSFVGLVLVGSLLFHIIPPKAQRRLKYGETGLRIKDEKGKGPKL
jgi:hypothetical protein